MARVYVSSTFQDLQEYREQVILTLHRQGHNVEAMEGYVAEGQRPVDKCLADVAACEVYIGIFAWRYGFIPDGHEKSITELEYRQAINEGKECLIFLVDEDIDWKPRFIEREAHSILAAFKDELRQTHMVSFFTTPDNLAKLVAEAMIQWTRRQEGRSQSTFASFERIYREEMLSTHRMVHPLGYGGKRGDKVPFDSLYVHPTIKPRPRRIPAMKPTSPEELPESLTLAKFQEILGKAVILASPGGGKSTLAEKLCVDFADTVLYHGKPLTPILVIMREYGVYRRDEGGSIADFIAANARKHYQLTPPDGFFEHLLTHSNTLVIFDGLDELLITQQRQQMTRNIEAFARRYPTAHILVTSREVGYDEAPLDEDFQAYALADFDDEQVSEYVMKWFRVELDSATGEEVTKTANAFQEELQNVPSDIRFNPLMLALLCNIYRGENYIPQNRPEIYEKCSEVLFDKRDRERGIPNDLPFTTHIRPTMAHLAYWIYGNPERENGVPERKLIAEAKTYLHKHKYADIDVAEDAARKFVRFCTGRAWVFQDVGLTGNGENLYQFTHRTFLEYFTAVHILRIHRTPQELLEVFRSRIAQGEQTVVAELAFQQMALDVEGAADVLLMGLLEELENATNSAKVNTLMFAMRSLAFIVPRETTVRAIVDMCFDTHVAFVQDWNENYVREGVYRFFDFHYAYDFSHFLYAVFREWLPIKNENFALIAHHLKQTLIKGIHSSDDIRAIAAAEFGMNLDSLEYHVGKKGKFASYLRKVSLEIIGICGDRIAKHLSPISIRICRDAYLEELVSLSELVAWYDTQAIFEQHEYLAFLYIYSGEIAPYSLSDLCKLGDGDTKGVDRLRQIGKVLLEARLPWMSVDEHNQRTWASTRCPNWQPEPEGDILFAVFAILAYWYERMYLHHFSEDWVMFPKYFHYTFLKRRDYMAVDEETLLAELAKCNYSPKQHDFVFGWSHGAFNVVGQ